MAVRTLPEYEEMEAALREAAPPGWYVGDLNVEQDRALDWPFRLTVTYRCHVMAGRYVEHGGRRSLRRLEADLSAHSLDDLTAAVRDMASAEALLGGPRGLEIRLDVSDR